MQDEYGTLKNRTNGMVKEQQLQTSDYRFLSYSFASKVKISNLCASFKYMNYVTL